jgi:hypothetical protein
MTRFHYFCRRKYIEQYVVWQKHFLVNKYVFWSSGGELSSYIQCIYIQYRVLNFESDVSGQHDYVSPGQRWISEKHRGVLTPTWRGFSQWDLGIWSYNNTWRRSFLCSRGEYRQAYRSNWACSCGNFDL